MDTQSISPLAGQPSGPQVQSSPQANANTRPTGSSAVSAGSTGKQSTDPELRVRDPRTLQYQVDGNTKQVVATIIDEGNKRVVVQIPDEEVLRIARAIDRMKGFLLEGKA